MKSLVTYVTGMVNILRSLLKQAWRCSTCPLVHVCLTASRSTHTWEHMPANTQQHTHCTTALNHNLNYKCFLKLV